MHLLFAFLQAQRVRMTADPPSAIFVVGCYCHQSGGVLTVAGHLIMTDGAGKQLLPCFPAMLTAMVTVLHLWLDESCCGGTGGSRRQQGAAARTGGQAMDQVGGAPGVYSTPPLAGQAQPDPGAHCLCVFADSSVHA